MEIYKLAVDDILNYSERRFLSILSGFPESEAVGKDYMDGDGIVDNLVELVVNVKMTKKHVTFDFTGTSEQVKGAINCPFAVTLSGSYYVLRAIIDPTIPANEGLYRHLSVIVPEGTVLNARSPAAVVGGNVETSQRIVDTLLKAFSKILPDRIPAASQGTMNNLIIGGTDYSGRQFTFYETIGGGVGGRPTKDGIDGIHSHMTNTMNTPIEEIEVRYPLVVEKYALREDSCGNGRFRGGLGIVRHFRTKVPVIVSLLGERQKIAPWGLAGGEDGKKGVYYVKKTDGKKIILPGKTTITLDSEELIVIETPGGGAWGEQKKRDKKSIKQDKNSGKVSGI
jgi:N-methylhydantoinase B